MSSKECTCLLCIMKRNSNYRMNYKVASYTTDLDSSLPMEGQCKCRLLMKAWQLFHPSLAVVYKRFKHRSICSCWQNLYKFLHLPLCVHVWARRLIWRTMGIAFERLDSYSYRITLLSPDLQAKEMYYLFY